MAIKILGLVAVILVTGLDTDICELLLSLLILDMFPTNKILQVLS